MRMLLCGFGSIGRRHFANASRLLGAPADWTVVEPNRELWQDGARFVPMLADAEGRYDVALVCSPTSAHLQQIEAVLDRCGALFVEKPLSHRLDGVDRVLAVVEQRRMLTMVGCNYRFEAGLGEVARQLAAGAIGPVLSVRAEFGQYLPSWRPTQDYRRGYSAQAALGGGVVLDRIHELDYLMWLFGPVTSVKAFSAKLSSLEIDSEDVAEILLRFSSGAFGSVHLDYLQRQYTCSLKVVGDRGSLAWTFKPSSVKLLSAANPAWMSLYDSPTPDVNDMYVAQMSHFLDCVQTGQPPMNGLAEAAETLRIALLARQSS